MMHRPFFERCEINKSKPQPFIIHNLKFIQVNHPTESANTSPILQVKYMSVYQLVGLQ